MSVPLHVPMGVEDSSFVLCDMNAQGFPIRHASPGFEELFGYDAGECQGRKCGALIGSECVLHEGMEAVGEASGLAREEAERAVRALGSKAADEIRAMVAHPTDKCGFALVVNRKKTGELIACELDMRVLRHPTLGWSYCVGLQRDVSNEVSAGHLLRTAAEGDDALSGLVESRRAGGQQARLLLGREASVKHMHETAAKMWQALVKATVATATGDKPKKSATPSIMSRSTTASSVSAASMRSFASARSATGAAAGNGTGVRGGLAAVFPVASGGAVVQAHDSPKGTAAVQQKGPGAEAQAAQAAPVPAPCAAAPVLPVPAAAAARAAEPAKKPAAPLGRFLDLLEDVDDHDDEPEEPELNITPPAQASASPSASAQVAPGAAVAAARLAEVVQQMDHKEVSDLEFSLVLAAPALAGCPLVSVSAGFESLTGFTAKEMMGQPCQMLVQGGPRSSNAKATAELQQLLCMASRGEYYPGHGERGMAFLGTHSNQEDCTEYLPEGELAFVHVVATRSGELTRCMFHLKQVELDDEMFIMGLQVALPDCDDANPEEHDRDATAADPQERCQLAFQRLGQNMDTAMQVLASQFWFSSPMRRQTACGAPGCGESDGD